MAANNTRFKFAWIPVSPAAFSHLFSGLRTIARTMTRFDAQPLGKTVCQCLLVSPSFGHVAGRTPNTRQTAYFRHTCTVSLNSSLQTAHALSASTSVLFTTV